MHTIENGMIEPYTVVGKSAKRYGREYIRKYIHNNDGFNITLHLQTQPYGVVSEYSIHHLVLGRFVKNKLEPYIYIKKW